MATRINKKTIFIILGSILGVLAIGASVYVIWRLNQPKEVTPEESQAGTEHDCCSSTEGVTCCASDEQAACLDGQECDGDGDGHDRWCHCTPRTTPDDGTCTCNCGGLTCTTSGSACSTDDASASITGASCSGPRAGCDGGGNFSEYVIEGYWVYTGDGASLSLNSYPCSLGQMDCAGDATVMCFDAQGAAGSCDSVDWSACTYCIDTTATWDQATNTLSITTRGEDIDGDNVRFRVTVMEDGQVVSGYPQIVEAGSSMITCARTGEPLIQNGNIGRRNQCTLNGTFSLTQQSGHTYSVKVDVADADNYADSWKEAETCTASIEQVAPFCGDRIYNQDYEHCELGDPGGPQQECLWSECIQPECVCQEETPPDWEIEKNGTPVCYEEGTSSVYADITYEIRIRNTAEGSTGKIEYVEDHYDDTIQQNWIISTSPTIPPGEITSEHIRWNLEGDDQIFEPCTDDSCWRYFRYTIRVPREAFGLTLHNQVFAHVTEPEPGDIYADEDIFVTCRLPNTGLFDSTLARIALGGLLLVVAGFSYKSGMFDNVILFVSERVGGGMGDLKMRMSKKGRRSLWENKVMDSAEKEFGKEFSAGKSSSDRHL
ncbi:hypothetical protein JW887_05695 [Candidatus Dojkabacteria bacterium]|nr:hypothetical protein [Candidatus Dojkabacteria bacterium]